jgi:hypothetical protein
MVTQRPIISGGTSCPTYSPSGGVLHLTMSEWAIPARRPASLANLPPSPERHELAHWRPEAILKVHREPLGRQAAALLHESRRFVAANEQRFVPDRIANGDQTPLEGWRRELL